MRKVSGNHRWTQQLFVVSGKRVMGATCQQLHDALRGRSDGGLRLHLAKPSGSSAAHGT